MMETQDIPAAASLSADDLGEIMSAYNAVTERLQASHEALSAETARLRDELASTNAQLQRSRRLSALGEMAAGIAHEIRNPLAAIRLYAEMASEDLQRAAHVAHADGTASDAFDQRLGDAGDNTAKILQAVQGLSGIVQDVLAFSTQFDPRRKAVAAKAVFAEVLSSHRPALDAAGVTVQTLGGHAVLDVDPDLLRRAVLNLVRNATDALAQLPAGAPRRIVVSAEVDTDGTAVLTVSDTGPGIPAEVAERIFNPFFTTRSTGTGLGLAIVHRIADAHGGAVTLGTARGGGARFELLLPPAAGAGAGRRSQVSGAGDEAGPHHPATERQRRTPRPEPKP